MSLTAGTPCSGCHYSPNGGGGRTELGWSSMNHVGALSYDSLGLNALHNQKSNQIADLLSVGIDIRLQGAHLGAPRKVRNAKGDVEIDTPALSWIPMQFQPYLALKPTEHLTLYGTFNPGPNTAEGDLLTQAYPGMNAFEAWAMYKITPTLFVRAGQFQPTVGIRHDDHTMMVRNDALDRRRPLLPPNYNELGLEVGYQPKRWLRIEVGGFDTTQLESSLASDIVESQNLSAIATSSRVTFLPQFTFGGAEEKTEEKGDGFDDFDDFGDFDAPEAPVASPTVINTWMGASHYQSGPFWMVNGFFGMGLDSGLTLMSEIMWSKRRTVHRMLNSSTTLQYALKDWLILHGRVERGQTHQITELTDEVAVAWQFVAGMEFFPVPYLEIRPEYRLIDVLDYRFGQATLQIHLFY